MKKIYCCLLAFFAFGGLANANPGDTTWVQANKMNLDYYNNFDTAVSFPDGSVTYRKIYLVFTLGQYDCPSGTQYCHQWDYDVHNYIMNSAGDTVEISRFITPFATSGWSRFGSTWQQGYIFDVTDFAPLLQGSAISRVLYSGYSGGFTADVKFAFVEGTPDRTVLGTAAFYNGSYDYGDTANTINSHLPVVDYTAPSGTQAAAARMIITGHGSDANYCCEFASHSYDFKVNGTTTGTQTLWRDDCGINELYPQGGTWVYDRANWCPGALVHPIYHSIGGVGSGTSFNLQIAFEDYSVASSFGSYKVAGRVIFYGAVNKSVDASLEEIVSPTNSAQQFRQNPSSNVPVIKVHNSGSTAITAMSIVYGLADSTQATYDWTGSIASLADATISLPALASLTNLANSEATGTFTFKAKIASVNGSADLDATNDSLATTFTATPKWPGVLVVNMQAGNITSSASISSGTTADWLGSWKITDMDGTTIASRDGKTNNTYNDTVIFSTEGFYKLTITSDLCWGLHWWPYDGTSSVKPGALWVKNLYGENLAMNGYTYAGSTLKDYGAHDDFGCEYNQIFYIESAGSLGLGSQPSTGIAKVYPNPATDVINLDIDGATLSEPASISLVNVLGQVVYATTSSGKHIAIDVSKLANGTYSLVYQINGVKKIEKVAISK
ncbi:MAG: peptide-N-glycosidase F-related protein [Edaphocola sp.]